MTLQHSLSLIALTPRLGDFGAGASQTSYTSSSGRGRFSFGAVDHGTGPEGPWFSWQTDLTGIKHSLSYVDAIEVHPLRILCHLMIDIVPDDELVAIVEQVADTASYYEPAVTPLVSLTELLAPLSLDHREAIEAE